ncbi:MAG: CDP-alcohol phosphatidyltransferase family protein, partial [Atopobiaceae bacterium]|nr:CDP-alcohol phosphatidyltransferase family protein [Atopobiaceae bacterium]
DAYLLAGSMVLQRYRRRPVDVSIIGKVTTALLMVGFCFLLLDAPRIQGLGLVDVPWLPVLNSEPGAVGILFVYLGVICSTLTAILYTLEGVSVVRTAREAS